MNDHLNRIYHFKGTPREIGFQYGRALGDKLEESLTLYITSMESSSDMEKLHAGALPWLRHLPKRFQEEFEGMAEGSKVPLQHLVEWMYIEECEKKECSGAVCMFDGHAWVARNNDTFVPELWGYATIREVDRRIPTINFSMEGYVFCPTGINKEKLWLHYNFLPVWDQPTPGKAHVPAYVLLTEALELCESISDVEALLKETDRDGGMLLFAIDGKTEEFAIFECLCSKHFRRDPADGWIVGTNHYCACEDPTLGDDDGSVSTVNRFNRMESLVKDLYASATPPSLPADLIHILADDKIERRVNPLVTVYSNVACPSTREIWYTFGGYPSASKGNWQPMEWPWSD